MITQPSATSVTTAFETRLIEELFLNARGCSRAVTAAHDDTQVARTSPDRIDAIDSLVAFENVVSDFLAVVAPAVLERAHLVTVIAPGYAESLINLTHQQIDALMLPIFEQAGIGSDFLPWQERFPGLAAADPAN